MLMVCCTGTAHLNGPIPLVVPHNNRRPLLPILASRRRQGFGTDVGRELEPDAKGVVVDRLKGHPGANMVDAWDDPSCNTLNRNLSTA